MMAFTQPAVPVSGLKTRLSSWLRTVRAGKTVVVTDRGRPVARIEPVSLRDDPERLTESLIAAGLASGPSRPLSGDFFEQTPVKDPDGRVLRALLAERGGGTR